MTMTIEWIRSAMTLVMLTTFIGIVLWAWSSCKQRDFESAARSVLEEDDFSTKGTGNGHE